MHGLTVAAEEARERGMTVSLILCFLRHLSEQQALETLEAAEPHRDELPGVGLDSTEIGNVRNPDPLRRVGATPSRSASLFGDCPADSQQRWPSSEPGRR